MTSGVVSKFCLFKITTQGELTGIHHKAQLQHEGSTLYHCVFRKIELPVTKTFDSESQQPFKNVKSPIHKALSLSDFRKHPFFLISLSGYCWSKTPLHHERLSEPIGRFWSIPLPLWDHFCDLLCLNEKQRIA